MRRDHNDRHARVLRVGRRADQSGQLKPVDLADVEFDQADVDLAALELLERLHRMLCLADFTDPEGAQHGPQDRDEMLVAVDDQYAQLRKINLTHRSSL